MPAPHASWYRSAREAVCSLASSLPAMLSGQTSRRDNVILSITLAAMAIPLFALVYIILGDRVAALFCLLATAGVALSAFLCSVPSRVALARETLTASIFLLLLALSATVGGGRAPAVAWFAVCPLIAAAGGGVSRGASWLGACLLAMLFIYVGDLIGIFPPPVVADMYVLSFIGNAGFLLLMGFFMMFYELNNTAAIRRVEDAMETI